MDIFYKIGDVFLIRFVNLYMIHYVVYGIKDYVLNVLREHILIKIKYVNKLIQIVRHGIV